MGAGFVTEGKDLTGGADTLGELDGVDGRRVGVDALDVDFVEGTEDLEVVEGPEGLEVVEGTEGLEVVEDREGLEVGVEDLAVDLVGVDDLEGIVVLDAGVAVLLLAGTTVLLAGAILLALTVVLLAETCVFVVKSEVLEAELMGLVAEGADFVEDKVAREVGVDDLAGLDAEVNEERPVGVEGLDPGPPEDEGLRSPALEEFSPGEEGCCLDTKLFLTAGSGWGFASYNTRDKLTA